MWKGGTGDKKVDHIIDNLGYFPQIPPLTFGHEECKGHCGKNKKKLMQHFNNILSTKWELGHTALRPQSPIHI